MRAWRLLDGLTVRRSSRNHIGNEKLGDAKTTHHGVGAMSARYHTIIIL